MKCKNPDCENYGFGATEFCSIACKEEYEINEQNKELTNWV